MDMVGKIFGFGKKGEPPSPQQAIQKLRETEEILNKKTEFLESKIDKEIETAKKNGTKNKRMALNALKRKKRLEKQLRQIDGTLSTIEFQRESLENAQTNTEVLKNMSYAAKALKAAHRQLEVDDIHDMMDDIAEQNEIAREISDAFVPLGEEFDEEELLAELEELEQKVLEDNLLDVQTPSSASLEDGSELQLPDVPTQAVPVAASRKKKSAANEDDDLRGLAAWATS
ncbi:Charged multivesicular body protein 4b [Geodia barretti]|uniref:Charged multivesicular body protein 4b n=1 Tax=Geodia barretti TaxID=519541 RepID=A0AA35W6U2_GEOBA|nr:Charged multivesicular body protein 4b [Geodia barretti]